MQNTSFEHLPRERLQRFGPSYLRDYELLAILLGSGTAGVDVLSLSKLLLRKLDQLGDLESLEALTAVPGIGMAKAATILASLEFARRRIGRIGSKIGGPSDAAKLLAHLADRPQEHFVSLSLNGAHELIALRTITVGLANATQVHPREVFADAITDRACAMIIAHNHPSGNLEPSEEDMRVTSMLSAAGHLLGIEVLDHVIVTTKGYTSLQERGLMSAR